LAILIGCNAPREYERCCSRKNFKGRQNTIAVKLKIPAEAAGIDSDYG
jgi:hypothetical protein